VKLIVDRFFHEPPGLAIIPETEYEAAVLARYWTSATLSRGRAASVVNSADGCCYTVKFSESDIVSPAKDVGLDAVAGNFGSPDGARKKGSK